jgi:hypothetical protein
MALMVSHPTNLTKHALSNKHRARPVLTLRTPRIACAGSCTFSREKLIELVGINIQSIYSIIIIFVYLLVFSGFLCYLLRHCIKCLFFQPKNVRKGQWKAEEDSCDFLGTQLVDDTPLLA